MGLYSGGAQLIAGTDDGTDNCPHDAHVPGLEALVRGAEHRPAPQRPRRPAGASAR